MSGTENNTLSVEHCAIFLCFSCISQGVDENYRNDVMKIHESGYIDFGSLNPEPGKQRIIISPPVHPNPQNQLRTLGVWRRIPKVTLPLIFGNLRGLLLDLRVPPHLKIVSLICTSGRRAVSLRLGLNIFP